MSDETITDLSSEIKRSFDLAVLRHEAGQLKSANDWRAFQSIRDRYMDARADLRENYQNSYEDRFNSVRAELLRKAAQKSPEAKPRFAATDRFNREAIDRQAHRIVRLSHQHELARLEDKETRELNGLLKQSSMPADHESGQQQTTIEKPKTENESRPAHTPVWKDRPR